jgi:hypothetical protein
MSTGIFSLTAVSAHGRGLHHLRLHRLHALRLPKFTRIRYIAHDSVALQIELKWLGVVRISRRDSGPASSPPHRPWRRARGACLPLHLHPRPFRQDSVSGCALGSGVRDALSRRWALAGLSTATPVPGSTVRRLTPTYGTVSSPPVLPPSPQNHHESPPRKASCLPFLQWAMCVAGSRVSPPLPADLRLALQRPPPHSSVPLRPSRSRPRGRCLPALITRVYSLSPHTTLLLAGNCGLASLFARRVLFDSQARPAPGPLLLVLSSTQRPSSSPVCSLLSHCLSLISVLESF